MNILRKIIGPPKAGRKASEHSPRRLMLAYHSDTPDDYKFIKTLGTGSFGRVFLAKRKDSNFPLAIKRLKKSQLVQQRQVDHIMSEKAILQSVSHPFIVEMYTTFKDDRYLFIVMEYVVGGEFFSYLRKCRRFKGDIARFYAAQITLIFEYIHSKDIIYRDLKPENILINQDGYLKLTDFGFAKQIQYRTFTLCGTPEYIAPEVLLIKGHGKPVDWWTLGILIYEMIVGYPPFIADEPLQIYKKILSGKIVFPRDFDNDAKSLVKRLLTHDLGKRYGNLKAGVDDIKSVKWFEGLDWHALLSKRITPPYKPATKSQDDTSHFDHYSDSISMPSPIIDDEDPFANW